MLRGAYFTLLRVDGGRQRLGCWEGKGGVGSGLGGGQCAPPKKEREGPFLQGSQVQKKNGEAADTKMIPKRYQNDTKMILK